jgi:hypothetical protein
MAGQTQKHAASDLLPPPKAKKPNRTGLQADALTSHTLLFVDIVSTPTITSHYAIRTSLEIWCINTT